MITVNGEPVELGDRPMVSQLVAQVVGAPADRGIAVAVNGEVVPRAVWEATALANGDRVEVLTANQGG